MTRLAAPPVRYDIQDQSELRRSIEQSLSSLASNIQTINAEGAPGVGTNGKIPVWGPGNTLVDSSMTESAGVITFGARPKVGTDSVAYLSELFTQTMADARYKPIGYVPSWGTVTGTPTTIAGYGITDLATAIQSPGDARWLKLTGGILSGDLQVSQNAFQGIAWGTAGRIRWDGISALEATNPAASAYVGFGAGNIRAHGSLTVDGSSAFASNVVVTGGALIARLDNQVFGTSPQSLNAANYWAWYASDQATRRAYIGLGAGSGSTADLYINSDSGLVRIQANGGSSVATFGTANINFSSPFILSGHQLFMERAGGPGGINWYSSTFNAWQMYMAPPGAGQGIGAALTAPSGSFVNSWALRSFIESVSGYGWTWEGGTPTGTAPSIVMELSSNSGNLRTSGVIQSTSAFGLTIGSLSGVPRLQQGYIANRFGVFNSSNVLADFEADKLYGNAFMDKLTGAQLVPVIVSGSVASGTAPTGTLWVRF